MLRRVLLGCACVLAMTGCSGDPDPLPVDDLSRLVLQPEDMGAYQRFDEGALTAADTQPGPRADPGRFGRQSGWKARYRVHGESDSGPEVVVSIVDLFRDGVGAERDLAAYREEFVQGRAAGITLQPDPELGEAAHATFQRQGEVLYFTVVWRTRNATGSVTISGRGLFGGTTLDEALRLARVQERKMRPR